MNEEEEDKFLKENPIVFKKYQVKRKLGEGAFGEVYLGQAIENNEYFALKVEPRKIAKPILQKEALTLFNLAGPGIPAVKSFGKVKNYSVLIEPLLGKSLFDIFAENHKEMPMEDICLIGKQVIDRIQWVHSKYIVHRDIKPDNFLIGKKDPNVIYLIDFGLSQKYRSATSGKHVRFGFTGKLTGTVRFASANALRGGEQSRRDDIESIGYMLVYFMTKRLPWQGVTGTRKMERYLKIYKMKKNTTPEELCKGLPPEMTEYMTYAKKLEFEQEPNYNYLRKLFSKILKRIHTTNDQLVFSWIKLKDIPNLKNPVNPSSRRESPQSRIYKKIKKSLERNMSSDSNDSKGSYQKVYSQAQAPNIKKVNINSIPDSEIEQDKGKKINKKLLKAREELNTMVANFDTFVDENAVDFDNEVLLKGSKDFGDITLGKNIFASEKKNINNSPSKHNSKKLDLINNNKNLINNYMEKLDSDNYNKENIEKIKNVHDIQEIAKKMVEKEKKENKETKENIEIKQENNNIINNLIQPTKENSLDKLNQIEKNNLKLDNQKDVLNPPLDSIKNMIFKNDIPNGNNMNNNLLDINNKNSNENINNNKVDNVTNQEKDSNNFEKNISLKISNFEGKEFTFNEALDYKTQFKLNEKMKEIIPESQENVLSEYYKDNAYSKFSENKKIPENMKNKNKSNNIKDIQNFPENNKLIINPINNINVKKQNKPNIDKNIINNNLNVNKKKLNKNIQIKKINPQKPKGIQNLNNEGYPNTEGNHDLKEVNNLYFPNDNNYNNNKNYFECLSNEQKLGKNSNINKILVLNKNNKNYFKQNSPTNKLTNKLIEDYNLNNNILNYNNLTFEKDKFNFPKDGIIDNMNNNNKIITQKELIKRKNLNKNNMRKKNDVIMQNNQNNQGNNITNININIRNNYVQNNDNNNNSKKINMNIKTNPNLLKNFTANTLINNFANNNISNLNQNKILISPQIKKKIQSKTGLNPNKNNIYPNNQIINNYPSNSSKNNLNIMIANQNQMKKMNVKKINNNLNLNNMKQIQLLTEPNRYNKFSNSQKNINPVQFLNFGGNNQKMALNMNMMNSNINYGIGMPSNIQLNSYANTNPNFNIGYNNNMNNNNLQNLNINNFNYQTYPYQP